MARWNGVAWAPIGGANAAVRSLAFDPNHNLYAGGVFTAAGGITMPDHFAMWNSSMWSAPDVNLPGTATIYSIAFNSLGVLTVGFDTAGTATSSVVTLSNNSSTKSNPIFVFTGPGKLWSIKNYSTGKAIYFTNLTLQAGEKAWLDLRPGQIRFWSSWRPNLLYAVSPGSNLSDFTLLPGDNHVACYIFGSTSAATNVYVRWQRSFWSASGGAN
jgi:hypothetical protein